jgi:16S rRNA processing protein RimM
LKNGQSVELGFCNSVHGLRGGLKLTLENPEESVLKKNGRVTLFPKNDKSSLSSEGKEFKISNIVFGHKVMIYFEGIDNRDEAESITPFTLKVAREDFPHTEEDEFYLVDLVGNEVFDHKDGQLLGKIEEYYEHPGQMVVIVKNAEKGKTWELPFVEAFFPKVEVCGDTYRIEMNQPEMV